MIVSDAVSIGDALDTLCARSCHDCGKRGRYLSWAATWNWSSVGRQKRRAFVEFVCDSRPESLMLLVEGLKQTCFAKKVVGLLKL